MPRPRPFKRTTVNRLFARGLANNSHTLTIGIRREDPARLWERRCPLTPSAVEELTQQKGVRVLVQPCDRRIFRALDFEQAGAVADQTLSSAHIILGIKEVPLSDLTQQSGPLPLSFTTIDGQLQCVPRTHLMFSHTGKGQPYNMPLLSSFLKPGKDRLIDYEFLTDGPVPTGKRVVAFGWFAGAAGVVEGLSASAHDFLSFGVASPFLYLPRPYMCRTVEGMRHALRGVGEVISIHGTPAATGPFVIAVTGNGNVAKGAISLLEELPHSRVNVEDLPSLLASPHTDLRKIYLVLVKPQDYLVASDGSSRTFSRSDYYSQPSDWKSIFHEKVAPFTTLLINGAGWQPGFPRLMTNEQLAFARKESCRYSLHGRFRTIADVSCDVKGGLEFMDKATTIDSPFYTAKPSTIPSEIAGVQIMSVDILPTQIPEDSSTHFSDCLMPYLRTLVKQYQGRISENDRDYVEALNRATITQNGELQGPFSWLYQRLGRSGNNVKATDASSDQEAGGIGASGSVVPDTVSTEAKTNRPKNILLLGSGMVARPTIEEISKRSDVRLVVASNNISGLDFMERMPNVRSKRIDMADLNLVNSLIGESDVVISLLPVPFHPTVASLCIKQRKHLVTASYISEAMKGLHQSALDADVVLLNEIGLDPGIDHCSAISLIDRIKSQNKRIKSFISFCGGLPAPECAGPDVPLRYKFSWSPRGVLNAALNSATFKLRNQIHNIQGDNLLLSYFNNVGLSGHNQIQLEGIANRDSLVYTDFYSLGPVERMETVLRGTLRYPGFSALMDAFIRIGLLESRSLLDDVHSWSALAPRALARKYRINNFREDDEKSFQSAVKDLTGLSDNRISELMYALSWLGITPSSRARDPITIPLSTKGTTPIDLFSYILSHKLRYQEKERDMVILTHEIIATPNETSPLTPPSSTPPTPEEVYTSTLIAYGTPVSGISAMARTVGLPVAFAALAIVDGRIATRGVCGPSMPELYRPVLAGLEEAGIGFVEDIDSNHSLAGKSLRDSLALT